jgi:hypothetical protein
MRHFLPFLTMAFVASVMPASALVHSADITADGHISLSELLRVVQFFNVGEYHRDATTEDGYAPGIGDTAGRAHDSDYAPLDWRIDIAELLRLIQFFNLGGYETRLGTEDGFLPAPERDPHRLPVPGDTDGDLLSDEEEAALSLDPANPHEFGEEDVDGAVLAGRIVDVLDALDWCPPEPSEGMLCSIPWEAECGWVLDPITGYHVNLDTLTEYFLGGPEGSELLFIVREEARHFMLYGSFSFYSLSSCGVYEIDDVWDWQYESIHRMDVVTIVQALDDAFPVMR